MGWTNIRLWIGIAIIAFMFGIFISQYESQFHERGHLIICEIFDIPVEEVVWVGKPHIEIGIPIEELPYYQRVLLGFSGGFCGGLFAFSFLFFIQILEKRSILTRTFQNELLIMGVEIGSLWIGLSQIVIALVEGFQYTIYLILYRNDTIAKQYIGLMYIISLVIYRILLFEDFKEK